MDSLSFKTSLGKKIIAVALCVTAFVFLSISIYGAPIEGYSTSTSISSDDSNITAYMYAVYNEHYIYNSSSGTRIWTPYLNISIRVVNNTNKWVVKNTDQIKVRINGITSVSSEQEITEIEGASIVETSHSSGYVDITIKADNSFILAPNETYTISFNFSSVAGFSSDPSVQFFNNQFTNSAYTVDELVSLPADELAYLGSINEGIAQVVAGMSYTGTGYTIDTQNYLNKLYSFNPVAGTVSSISVNVRRYVYPVILNNVDFELDTGDDELISTQSYIYKVAVYIYVNNYSGKAVKINRLPTISNFIPEGAAAEITTYNSQFFNTYALNQRNLMLGTTYRLDNNTSAGVLPSGRDYTFIQYTVYSPTKITTWPDYSFNVFNDTDEYADGWYPESQESLFYNWYNSYNKVNGLDDISNSADEISSKSENAHTQEQNYFTQNAQAIAQTGLSNYRFSTDQENGIGSVSHDFTLLWNALGGFNSVYIFSLTLSLALMVLRHAPSAIKSSRRNKEE